jgi:hypothetical protein
VFIERLQVNCTKIENSFWKARVPVKSELFQIIMIPPDAPIEGKNSNLLNIFG